ncbi:biotin synthase BioB [Buchnera aphidicola]|uniref:Biotin synthase n=1 Tax=Buchnera aphidicola (Anoecia oenotherae) TaxID=1241833 RepID=A0A4D6Y0G9_9GAMM|nr:biotin synthase BioB [Buchnera aphidicola (Anoecia oenotherae)]
MKKIWTLKKIKRLFQLPLLELLFLSQTIHRKNFSPNTLQISTLLSIKTGSCPEDCKYCPQSARYKTNIKKEKLLELKTVLLEAKKAKLSGSDRFCLGAAWKSPSEKNMPYLEKIIKKIKNMGMETCMTLGSLTNLQAKKLANAGLDFYNHNLDTSPKFYKNIITTRKYEDRLKTLEIVRKNGIKVCSGGIIGLGETMQDRIELLVELSNLSIPPESIPINMLVRTKGTPMENNQTIDPFEFIRVIAVARVILPSSYIRLSAGRKNMNEQTQAMCFMAGANSVFYGCKLLTTKNPDKENDLKLFKKLGLNFKNTKINKESNYFNTIKTNKENNTKKLYYNATI